MLVLYSAVEVLFSFSVMFMSVLWSVRFSFLYLVMFMCFVLRHRIAVQFVLYLSILVMLMSILCSVIFSFLYLVMFMCFVLRHRIAVQFFFVNFSNAHVCFMFRHVQFFVFVNFSNVIQVLYMFLNLQVYLVFLCLYQLCVSSLILCTSVFCIFQFQ